MKTAPPINPRQLTPAFDYALKFCRYGWVCSIDENGVQSRSLAPQGVWYNILAGPVHESLPLYQVHELPVLDELQS